MATDIQQQLEMALSYLEQAPAGDVSADEAWALIDEIVYDMRLQERLEWLRGARVAGSQRGTVSMHIAIKLTTLPPYCIVGRNDLSEEPLWFLELWPMKNGNEESVAFLADSLDDLDTLWQAIRSAVDRRRQVEQDGHV